MAIKRSHFTAILSCVLLLNILKTLSENVHHPTLKKSVQHDIFRIQYSDPYSFDTPTSFAILVNFGRDGQQRNLYSSHSKINNCDENQVWDPFSNQCRQVYCKDHYELHELKCVGNLSDSSGNHPKPYIKFLDSNSEFVNVTLGFKSNQNITESWFQENRYRLQQVFQQQFASECAINQTRLINITSYPTSPDSINFDFLIIESQEYMKNDQILAMVSPYIATRSKESIAQMFDDNTKRFEFQYQHIEFVANQIHTTLAEVNDFCIEDDEMPIWYWNSDFSIAEVDNKTCIYVNSTGRRYEPGEYIGSVLLVESLDSRGRYQKNASSNAVVCEKTLIDEDCPRIMLNRTEYKFVDGRRLMSTITDREYDKYEFTDNSSIFVCYQEPKASPAVFQSLDSKIESYLSTVMMSISAVLLMLMLVTYVSTQALRSTVNGFNTINLVACLMMMQLIFLVNQFVNDCHIFTPTFHFFILATIAWSCIIAYDIHRVFVSGKYQNRTQNARSGPVRLIYLFSAYLMPVAVITVAKIGDWFKINEIRADYGKLTENPGSGCWMRSKNAQIYYFIVPVAISVVFNFVLYIRIVLNIHTGLNSFRSFPKVTRINSGSSDTSTVTIISLPRNRMISENECKLSVKQSSIYIRLSVPLGFTWVIALFSQMIPWEYQLIIRIMTYLFILANTSQGVILFIAFGVYRRIWNVLTCWSEQ